MCDEFWPIESPETALTWVSDIAAYVKDAPFWGFCMQEGRPHTRWPLAVARRAVRWHFHSHTYAHVHHEVERAAIDAAARAIFE
jgi:hypothetical protein